MNQTISSLAELCRKEPLREKWLLCPSRRIGQQWLDLVAMSGTPVVHLRLHSVSSLAVMLAQPVLIERGLSYLPDAAGSLVVAMLWSAVTDTDDPYLSRLEPAASLYRALYRSVRDLRLAGVDLDRVSQEGFHSQAKGRELGTLLELYSRELARLKRADYPQVLDLAIRRLDEDASVLPGELALLLPEEVRSGLSGREGELFAALTRRIGDQGVVCLASDTSLLLPDSVVPEATQGVKKISWHTEPRFFRAVGKINEVRQALRRGTAAAGRLDRMELLHTDTATYVPLIYETAARLTDDIPRWERGMPVTFAEGIPASYTRPGRALTAWIEWIEHDFPQTVLHRMFMDGLLELPSVGGGNMVSDTVDGLAASGGTEAVVTGAADPAEGEFAAIPRCLRSVTIGHGLDRYDRIRQARDATERRLADDNLYLDDTGELNESRRHDDEERLRSWTILWQMVEPLSELSRGAAGGPINLLESADGFLERFGRRGNTFDALALQRLRDQIGGLKQLVDEVGVDSDGTRADVVAWLGSLAQETRVGGSGPRPGHLHVAHVLGGGHCGRPVTVVIGLDDGSFPGPVMQDPILLDQERTFLNAEHGQSSGLRLSHHGLFDRREAFGRLLGRLRGRVFLGFSCYDILEQREQFPSPLLLAAFRSHTGDAEADPQRLIDDCGEAASFVPQESSTSLDENEWWVSSLVGDRGVADTDTLMDTHFPHLRRGVTADAARRGTAFTEFDGRIDGIEPRLVPTHQEGPVVSASRLETFGTCPLRYFFKHVLQIAPPPDISIDPDRWLDPLAYGQLLHEVLRRFMQEVVIQRGEEPQYTSHIARLKEILETCVQEYRQLIPPPNERAYLRQRRRLDESAELFLSTEEEWCKTRRPLYLEAAFGRRRRAGEIKTDLDRIDPVRIALSDEHHLRIRAQVDRIDRHRHDGSFEICDYKSGYYVGKYVQSDPFAGGRCLQHILYLHVVRSVLSEHLETPVKLDQFHYFFPTPEQGGRRFEFGVEDLSDGIDCIAAMCEQIGKGAFIGTTQEQDCNICDYQSICSAAWGDLKDAARCNRAKRHGDNSLWLAPMDRWRRLGRKSNISKRNKPAMTAGAAPQGGTKTKPVIWPGESGAVSKPIRRHRDQLPPDEKQRRKILEQIDVNMMVEAAAGTGKTTMMVDRMVRLVRTGRCAVDHMAAVTFTRKAAAELRDRFHRALRHEAIDASDSLEKKRLRAALNALDRCFIGTIHSFCASMLRERPVEAAVDIGFEEIDDLAGVRLRQLSWRNYLDELQNRQDLTLGRLDALGLQVSDLMTGYERICDYPDVTHWPVRYPHDPVESPPELDGEKIQDGWKAVCHFVEEVRDLSCQFPRDGGKLMQSIQEVVQMVDRLGRQETVKVQEMMAVFGELREYDSDNSGHMSKTKWPGANQKDKTALAVATCSKWNNLFTHHADPLISMCQQVRYEPVLKVLRGAVDSYACVRAQAGVLNYQDLLMKARDLLRDHDAVRRDLALRYTHVLVDEFQDTDPIQAEILSLLTGEVGVSDQVPHWTQIRSRAGSLFVVGDPKQSIYRFRRADIETYDIVKGLIIKSGGSVVALQANFRSTSAIVEWVNSVFKEMFPVGGNDRYGPDYQDFMVGRAEEGNGQLRGVAVLNVAGTSSHHKKTAASEAEMIARCIQAAVGQKVVVARSVDEVRAGKQREVEFGDFLIISRQKSRLHLYARALECRGIPCEITGGRSLNEVRELALLHTCLKAVLNPDDETALVAAMRSSLFGISDAALYAIHRAGGRFSYRRDPPVSAGAGRGKGGTTACYARHEIAPAPAHAIAIKDVFERMRRYDRWLRRMPPIAAIEKIVSDLGLMVRAAMASGGQVQAGSISRAIELMRAAERQFWTASDLVDYLERLIDPRAEGAEEQDGMPIYGHGRSCVRLMNLHKAKGLEAPVVFLVDPCGHKQHDVQLHIRRHGSERGEIRDEKVVGYMAVHGPSGPFGASGQILAKAIGWDIKGGPAAEERKFQNAETKRLLYVAATRAGSQLIIARRTDDKGQKHNPWQAFDPYLNALPSLQVPGTTTAPTMEPLVFPDSAPTEFRVQLRTFRSEIANLSYLTSAAKRLGMGGLDPEEPVPAVAEEHWPVADVVVMRTPDRESGLACGLEWGEVIHRLLEAAMHAPGTDLESLAVDILAELDSDIYHATAASEAVRRVMASDIWRRARRSPQCYTEVPFCIREDCDDKPRLVRGAIDLAFREQDRWSIVDYKTDRIESVPSDDLLRRYCGQVAIYRSVWSSIHGIPLARIEGSIYFTRPNRLVKC